MRVLLIAMLVSLVACTLRPQPKSVWAQQEQVVRFHEIAWFDEDWRICEVGINCPLTTGKSPIQGMAITSAIDQTHRTDLPQTSSRPILVQFGFDQQNPDLPLALGDLLKALGDDDRIRITGYTDSTGDKAYNQKLAHARAKQVAAWIERLGVKNPLEIIARGGCCYLVPNDTERGRARNRRVEILIIEKENQDE